MQQLLLVNPRKRRAGGRKHRSAAQKAATRRMLAANRSRRGSKRRAPAYASNPAPRRHKRRSSSLVARHVKRRSRRRNPISIGRHMGSITSLLKSAALGAGGAVVTDVAYGYLNSYLPAAIQSPVAADGTANYGYYMGKGAAAVGLGMLLRKVIGQAKAGRMVEGSLIVTLHDLAKVIVASNLSSVKMGTLNPGRNAGGTLPGSASVMGKYIGKYVPMSGQNVAYRESVNNLR